MSTDELRRAIEALPGHKEMTYYHRWAAGIRSLNPRSMQENLLIIMKRHKVTTENRAFPRKGNSNFELGAAICYVNEENYFLTIIKHIAVPSSKLELPFGQLKVKNRGKLIYYYPPWKK